MQSRNGNSFYHINSIPLYIPSKFFPVNRLFYPFYQIPRVDYQTEMYLQQPETVVFNDTKNTKMNINKTDSDESNNKKNDKIIRKKFSKEEDEHLKKLVEQIGCQKWKNIAKHMPGRTGRQCRDRYQNYLVPGFFNGHWSKDEDVLLLKLYKEYGSKWSQMTKFFNSRNSNSLKNRWNYYISKHLKDFETNSYAKSLSGEIKHLNDEKQFNQNDDFLESNITYNFSFIDFEQNNTKED